MTVNLAIEEADSALAIVQAIILTYAPADDEELLQIRELLDKARRALSRASTQIAEVATDLRQIREQL